MQIKLISIMFGIFQQPETKIIASLTDNINVHYKSDFLSTQEATKLYKLFQKKLVYNTKEESSVKFGNKIIPIPRSQAAYGEPGTYYKFTGHSVLARSWDDDTDICRAIKRIKERVELFSKEKFNFVLINHYKDGSQNIGWHMDDERQLLDKPTIVGVSLGSPRDFQLKSKDTCKHLNPLQSITVDHGSILLIKHPTNQNWYHCVPKRKSVKKPRISLTFRYIVKASA